MEMKHAMISRACKAVLSEQEEVDLPELLYSHGGSWSAAQLAESFCEPFCEAAGGEEGSKDEL